MKLSEIIFPYGGNRLWAALAGKDNASRRQQVAEKIGQKLTRGKNLYHTLEQMLFEAAGIRRHDYTLAEGERLLIEWIKSH